MNQKPFCGKIAAVCAASLMLLTSCSSNSGGIGGGGVMPPIFSAEQLQLLSESGIADAETTSAGALQTALEAVANIRPRLGNGPIFVYDGPGIARIDVITDGNDVYQSEVRSRVSVKVTPRSEGLLYTWDLDRPPGGGGDARGIASGAAHASNSSDMFSSIAFDHSALTLTAGASASNDEYYVSIFTDHDGSDNDPDYLAAGFWLHVVPEDMRDAANVSFGAFADSDSPFDISSLLSRTAAATMATYSGKATGLCNCASGADATVAPRVFDADVGLVANFGPNSGDDTISGEISDFVVDGDNLSGKTIYLQKANLTNASSGGFFTGSTSLVSESETGANLRHWGGEFYGDATRNTLPGSVGGTFGASDGTETFVGAFGAHRQEE